MKSSKKILITGYTSSIGRQICTDLISSGHELIMVGRRKPDFIGKFYEANFEDMVAFEKVIKLINEDLDGVILCSATAKIIPASLIKSKNINEIFNINVFSNILLIKHLLKKKSLNKRSSLIYLSSIAAHRSERGNSLYASSKSAMESFLRSLVSEVSIDQIRVNSIAPGLIDAGMGKKFLERLEDKESILNSYPLGIGSVESVSGIIEFLLSDSSRWMTGQTLVVDGGHLNYQGF